MKELEYPFDSKLIMRKRKAFKRELEGETDKRIEKRIAVLGGSTTHDVIDMLELFLLNYGIKPVFYESEYGKYWEDSMFDNIELDTFKPDIIYIHTNNKNIFEYPAIGSDDKSVESLFEKQNEHFQSMWESLTEKYHCPIIQNNFDFPQDRIVGNMATSAKWGKINFINRLNLSFAEYSLSHDNLFINDINYQSAEIGLNKWYDPFAWFMYKYAVSLDAIPMLAFNVANIIKSIYGKNKKAIAVDLDNTLWGGVVGDDGVEGLQIGNETPRGQIYEAFQRYLKSIQSAGVLLNIISKNEEKNAIDGLRNPGMVLSETDFISIKANWEPKSENLLHMAEELSLGPDSFVFIDDNPAEREIVRQQVPGAGVPTLEKAERYIEAIDKAGYFEMTSYSADDAKRNEMYRENAQRASLKSKFSDYKEYLESLEMKAEIQSFQSVYLDRIAQLTNKSNQFNLTTLRCTRDEIEQMKGSDNYITLYGKLKDKFGDNGVVAVVIGKKKDEELDIILWLMSCRVLKRDLEIAMMDELVSKARQAGIQTIKGYYYPTKKNGMVKDFYGSQGFEKFLEDPAGNSVWRLDVEEYQGRNSVITIVRE